MLHTLAKVGLFLTLLAAPGAGQAAPEADASNLLRTLADPEFDARTLSGDERGLVAHGSNFSATIGENGVRFSALGSAGGHAELGLEVVGLLVEGQALPLPKGTIRAEGTTGEIARGSLFTERYEVQASGIKQSFVFAERPKIDGDLVVRLAVTSDLDVVPGDRSGAALSFADDTGTWIEIGEVLGVDAAGEQCEGSSSFDGTHLDLMLPAAFVSNAEYPLVLDPWIGSTTELGTFTHWLREPVVSYDVSTDRWLLVCTRAYFVGSNIFGYRFDGNLQPVGMPIVIANAGATTVGKPAVANINSGDRFIVVWESSPVLTSKVIRIRSVDAQSGSLGLDFIISQPLLDAKSPVISGEFSSDPSRARVWVVFEQETDGIEATQLEFLGPNPSSVASFDLSDAAAERPSISRSGGPAGRHVVCWQSSGAQDSNLLYAVLDSTGALATAPSSFQSSPSVTTLDIEVDGDGDRFFFAWRQQITFGSPPQFRIFTQCRDWTGSSLGNDSSVSDMGIDFGVDSGSELNVAFTGNRFLYLQSFETVIQSLLRLTGFAYDACEACTSAQLVGGTPEFRKDTAITARWASGDANSDQALVVWGVLDATGDFDVKANLVEGVTGDLVTDLGGGCGLGGTLESDSPYVGNSTYSMRIVGADPGASTAIVNMRRVPILFTCGTCVSNVNVGVLEVLAMNGGFGQLDIPIPCSTQLIGFRTQAQAIAIVPTAASPCPQFANLSTTNRLELTIGQ